MSDKKRRVRLRQAYNGKLFVEASPYVKGQHCEFDLMLGGQSFWVSFFAETELDAVIASLTAMLDHLKEHKAKCLQNEKALKR